MNAALAVELAGVNDELKNASQSQIVLMVVEHQHYFMTQTLSAAAASKGDAPGGSQGSNKTAIV